MGTIRLRWQHAVGADVDAGSSGAHKFANTNPTSPPSNAIVPQMVGQRRFPIGTYKVYDNLFEHFPYLPNRTVLMLNAVFPEGAGNMRTLVTDPWRIISGVESLEEKPFTRVSNAVNYWMGLPEGIDLEKWKLCIRLWLICMRTMCENNPRDDVVTLNVSLVRLLIAALSSSDSEGFEALRTMDDALTDWGEYVFDMFQYQLQLSSARISEASQVLRNTLPYFDEKKDFFVKKLSSIFKATRARFPMTVSGEPDMLGAIKIILREDLQFLRTFAASDVGPGLILHICETIGQTDIPAPCGNSSMHILGYMLCIYALLGCEIGFCPYDAGFFAAICLMMRARNIGELDLARRTTPAQFRDGVARVFFTCSIEILCRNFFSKTTYDAFWECRQENGVERTISAEIELLRLLLGIFENNSIAMNCDGVTSVLLDCFLRATHITTLEKQESVTRDLLDIAFRFSMRSIAYGTPGASGIAARTFTLCHNICVQRHLNTGKMFIEMIINSISPTNIDRIVAELRALSGKSVPLEIQEALPSCIDYINKNDWRHTSQAVESEEIRYDILDLEDNLRDGINVLCGSQPSHEIACQALAVTVQPAEPMATVLSPPVAVQLVAKKLSVLLIKSQWSSLANLVQKHTLIDVDGDGNCLYRSISVIFLGEELHYRTVRSCMHCAALALARRGFAEIQTYFIAAIVSPGVQPYKEWLLDFAGTATKFEIAPPMEIQRFLQATAGKNKQQIMAQAVEYVTIWLGIGADPCVHVEPLLWIYAISVTGRDGRWGELPDLAIIAYCLRITIVVHTLGGAHIRFGGGAKATVHLASDAGEHGGGTHWNAYFPDDEEERENLNELFRAKFMSE
ncbi:MAG: hypothetical protein LBI34_03960 [Puniceicoccales bacterium]|jgi:hypothetical protein|nr:hypothetical protein [Puniceicoccales bacterium]